MTALTGLQCHVCRTPFPAEALFVCDKCFGPLEVVYDYDAVRRDDDPRDDRGARRATSGATASCCRSTGEPRTGLTPATRRWSRPIGWPKQLGVRELYVKDDSSTTRRSPTRIASSRSRPRAPSSSASTVFGCASTGNLAQQRRRRTPRASGLHLLRLHPGRSRAGQGRSAPASTSRSWSPSAATTTT